MQQPQQQHDDNHNQQHDDDHSHNHNQQHHHRQRVALLLTELLAPPLPMVTLDSDGREKVHSSHLVIATIAGRLDDPVLCTSAAGGVESKFSGDWLAHAVCGDHAVRLVDKLRRRRQQLGPVGSGDDCAVVETLYECFCTYTRELISLLVSYDLCSLARARGGGGGARNDSDEIQDVRFLADPGRVSTSQHAGLCIAAVEFYCCVLLARSSGSDNDDAKVQAARDSLLNSRDYRHTIARTMVLLCEHVAETMT